MGKRGPKKGIKFSEEHKEKIRQSKLRYKPSQEHIENARKGLIEYYKNHPEAIERLREIKRQYRHTEESKLKISKSLGGRRKERFYGFTRDTWTKKQLMIKKRDNFTCQECGFKGNSRNLNVHHINPFKYSKDNSDENLITLCIPCHGSIEYLTRKK